MAHFRTGTPRFARTAWSSFRPPAGLLDADYAGMSQLDEPWLLSGRPGGNTGGRHALSAAGLVDAAFQVCQCREHVVEGGWL